MEGDPSSGSYSQTQHRTISPSRTNPSYHNRPTSPGSTSHYVPTRSPSHPYLPPTAASQSFSASGGNTSLNSVIGGGAVPLFPSSEAALITHLREDNAAKERLLMQAQAQVKDLLRHKEEAFSLRSEVQLLTDRIRAKDEEIRRFTQMLENEKAEKQHTLGAMHEKQRAESTSFEHQEFAQAERIKDLSSLNLTLKREVEKKDTALRTLESEIATLKNKMATVNENETQYKITVARLQANIQQHEAKVEESLRSAVKADTAKSSIQTQLYEREREAADLRDELETLRAKRNSLVVDHTQASAQRDSLQRKVEDLSEELAQIPTLHREISILQASLDNQTSMKHALEDSQSQIANERGYRRTLELDKEQLHLQIKSFETDVKKLGTELYKAQCDAAEKLALKRELSERQDALEMSHRNTMQLQNQVQELKHNISAKAVQLEQYESDVSATINVLRRAAEAATSAGVNCSAQDSIAMLPNFSPRRGRPTLKESSELQQQTQHGMDNSTASSPPSMLDATATYKSCDAVFYPLQTALRELMITAHEERNKNSSMQKMLNEETSNNAHLESNLQMANRSLTQAQLRIADLDSMNHSVNAQLSAVQKELNSATTHLAEHLSHLSTTFGRQHGTWEGVLETAQEFAANNDGLRKGCDALKTDLSSTQNALAQEKIHRTEENKNWGEKYQNDLQDLKVKHASQMQEASNTQNALKEKIEAATKTHDEVVKDANELQKNYHQTVVSLTEAQHQILDLKGKLGEANRNIESIDIKLRTSNSEHEDTKTELEIAHQEIDQQNKKITSLSQAMEHLTARNTQEFASIQLLVRALLGVRTSLKLALQQRNIMSQYLRSSDQALRLIETELAEKTTGSRALPRKTTVRIVAIAVLMHGRFTKILQQVRRERSNAEQISSPTKARKVSVRSSGSDKLDLPKLCVLKESNFAPNIDDKTLRLPNALTGNGPHNSVLEIVGQFEMDNENVPRYGNSLLHAIASGIWSNRRLALSTPTQRARKLADNFGTRIQQMKTQHEKSQRDVTSLRAESSQLQRDIRDKASENEKYSGQIAQLLSERTQLVDKRVHETVTQELARTRTDLNREMAEKRRMEDKFGSVQSREMDLLSKHTALQNEAKNMAVELAARSASGANLTALSRGSNSQSPSRSVFDTNYLSPTYVLPGKSPTAFDSTQRTKRTFSIPEIESRPETPTSEFQLESLPADTYKVAQEAQPIFPAPNPFGSPIQHSPYVHDYTNTSTSIGFSPSSVGQPPQSYSSNYSNNAAVTTSSGGLTTSKSAADLLNMIRSIDNRISGALDKPAAGH